MEASVPWDAMKRIQEILLVNYVIGTRPWKNNLEPSLITHELGHVIYDQVYDSGLPEDEDYTQSERFAMYMETHFDLNMDYLTTTGHYSISPRLSNMLQSIAVGVAISAAA